MGCEVGAMLWGWDGWRAESAHGVFSTFPIVLLQKSRNGNCERGCEEMFILRSWDGVVEGGLPHIST